MRPQRGGRGSLSAVRGYRLFECPGKARPACSSHVKQLFVWGSQGWGQGLEKGPNPLASFLFPRKGEGCRDLLGVRTAPFSSTLKLSMVGLDGVLPSTPLARLWEKAEHKEGGWLS